jgi:hypothetical protein
MSIQNAKNLWDITVFFSLPVDDEAEDFGIYWEEYVENRRVSVPSDLQDWEAVLRYIQKSCPYHVDLISASRVSAEPNS